MGKKGLLERLQDGVVIGDGGFVIALEKRGYVIAGSYTPEASIKHPEAVLELHREFFHAGSDVAQTFTFYSTDNRLKIIHKAGQEEISCTDLNNAACNIAKRAASENGGLVAGSISQNVGYKEGKGKTYIQSEIKKQVDAFLLQDVDFVICEFFEAIEEMEWAIEEVKKSHLPVMATMCINKNGDYHNIPIGECGIRMAKAKADVVGLNCMFDPEMSLDAMSIMKLSLDREGLHPYLAMQPNGFFTTNTYKLGYLECPEYPHAMESRTITRMDAHKYARRAYELGVRYIGGCCGFEAYHIRAMANAISEHRSAKLSYENILANDNESLKFSSYELVRARASTSYWENLIPHSGRKEHPTYPLPT